MAVSATGQGLPLATVRHALATVLVFLGLFTYFYGPPLTPTLSQAAQDSCNARTGSDYRNYSLVWRTTTYKGIDAPHWVCFDLSEPGRPGTSLGWWVTP